MPTAPDNTWTALLNRLADNNSGAISEEDVRAIARYAKTSYAFTGGSGMQLFGENGSPPNTSEPTSPPAYDFLTAHYTYSMSENYLSVGPTGFVYIGGGQDQLMASRLVSYSWDVELFTLNLEHTAIGWWYVPANNPWPNNIKRHRYGRMYFQNSWIAAEDMPVLSQTFERDAAAGYVAHSAGTGIIVLNPGDVIVPLLEHYGPSNNLSGSLLSQHCYAYTVGVVDAWDPVSTSGFNDAVSDVKIDTDAPFTHLPASPRLYGNIIA